MFPVDVFVATALTKLKVICRMTVQSRMPITPSNAATSAKDSDVTELSDANTTCLFLSHSKKDVEKAHQLRQQLIDAGYPAERVFIDDDPQHGLIPGSKWRSRLSQSLKRTACLLVLSTENWKASKWCHGEAMVADALGRIILPLDVDGSWEAGSYGDIQAVRNFDVAEEESVERLLAALMALDLSTPTEPPYDMGWYAQPFDDAEFNRAVWRARLRILATANLAASILTLLLVGILLWCLVIEPSLAERSEIRQQRRQFAVQPDAVLAELAKQEASNQVKKDLEEREGDPESRLGIRVKLTSRKIQRIKTDRRLDDIEASGFDVILYFADSRTWPVSETELHPGWWMVTGEVQDVIVSASVDDAGLGIPLRPVQQLSLENCVPFETTRSPDAT